MPEFPLYYYDVLYINAVMETDPVCDDESTMQGEEPSHREASRRRNRCRNIQRHHAAGEQDLTLGSHGPSEPCHHLDKELGTTSVSSRLTRRFMSLVAAT